MVVGHLAFYDLRSAADFLIASVAATTAVEVWLGVRPGEVFCRGVTFGLTARTVGTEHR